MRRSWLGQPIPNIAELLPQVYEKKMMKLELLEKSN
jgi:hypothetical protein